MSIKKISMLSVLALSAVGLLGGCAGGGDSSSVGGTSSSVGGTSSSVGGTSSSVGGTDTVILSGPSEAQSFTLNQAQEWAKKNNKSYTFKYVTHGEDKVDTEVIDWTSSQAPDIFMYANDKQPGLVNKQVISAISSANLKTLTDTYGISQTYLDTVSFQKKTYGYPYTLNGYCFWYNEDMAKNATKPEGIGEDFTKWTMEEWIQVAKANNYQITYNLKTAYYSAAFMTSDGGSWDCTYDRNGKLTKVTSDFAEKGMLPLKSAIKWYDYTNSDGKHTIIYDTQKAPTANNKVLADVNGAWALTTTAGGDSEYADPAIKCSVIPAMTTAEGEKVMPRGFTGSKAFGVNGQKSAGDTARLNDLHSLASYLVSPEVQKARFEFNASWLPTTDKAGVTASDNKAFAALNEQLAKGIAQANLPQAIWNAPVTLFTKITGVEASKDNPAVEATLNVNSTDEQLKAALAAFDAELAAI